MLGLEDRPYISEILRDFEESKKNKRYEINNEMLLKHSDTQQEDVQFWIIVITYTLEIENKILKECHAVACSVHPGVQRTLNKSGMDFTGEDKLWM